MKQVLHRNLFGKVAVHLMLEPHKENSGLITLQGFLDPSGDKLVTPA